MSPVAVLTEGGVGIGLGHVTESAHLIGALRRLGAEVVCWVHGPRVARDGLARSGARTVSMRDRLGPGTASTVSGAVRRIGARLVFCNVMRLDPSTVGRLSEAGLRVTAIVEGAGPSGLDPGFDVVARPELMILAPELVGHRREDAAGAPLLLTMGGCDARGLTPRLVRWLGGLEAPPDLQVVVGALFGHEEALRMAVERYPGRCRVVRAPRQPRLFRLMRRCSAAVTHGGDTLYELACLGVPTAVVCPTVRQLRVARRFEADGAALNLGLHRTLPRPLFQRQVGRLLGDRSLRLRLARNGRALVDGRGAQRVAEALLAMNAG